MRKLRMETELWGVPLVVVGASYGSPPHEVELDEILHLGGDVSELVSDFDKERVSCEFLSFAREMWAADACEHHDNLREERRLEREFA